MWAVAQVVFVLGREILGRGFSKAQGSRDRFGEFCVEALRASERDYCIDNTLIIMYGTGTLGIIA